MMEDGKVWTLRGRKSTSDLISPYIRPEGYLSSGITEKNRKHRTSGGEGRKRKEQRKALNASSVSSPAPLRPSTGPRPSPGHQVSGSFNLLFTGLAAWDGVHSLFSKYQVL